MQFRSENHRSFLQVNDILNLDLKNDRISQAKKEKRIPRQRTTGGKALRWEGVQETDSRPVQGTDSDLGAGTGTQNKVQRGELGADHHGRALWAHAYPVNSKFSCIWPKHKITAAQENRRIFLSHFRTPQISRSGLGSGFWLSRTRLPSVFLCHQARGFCLTGLLLQEGFWSSSYHICTGRRKEVWRAGQRGAVGFFKRSFQSSRKTFPLKSLARYRYLLTREGGNGIRQILLVRKQGKGHRISWQLLIVPVTPW